MSTNTKLARTLVRRAAIAAREYLLGYCSSRLKAEDFDRLRSVDGAERLVSAVLDGDEVREALAAAHDAEQAAQAVPAGFVPAFVLRNVLATLEHENTSGSAIQDTIWHSPGETLFDYIENSLEQFDATAAPAPEAQDSARTSPAHQPVHGWTDADADAARLALELECILLDPDTPMPLASRWWDSAHEALALHRQRLASEQSHGIGATTGEQR